jgi:hypothetical protein
VRADRDSVVMGRRMFSGDDWVVDDILDWAAPAAAGFAGIVLPAGSSWCA